MAKNLQPIIQELHKTFNHLNEVFYDNKLPDVVIAIRSQGKRKGVLGWFTPAKVWADEQGNEKHEIVITAETLNRDFMDIAKTLHHEMIHLYCHVNDIKDTSRSGLYHNKEFKKACLAHGFYYADDKPDSSIGWSYALLTEQTEAIINSFKIRTGVFGLARKSFGGEKEKKKSNSFKWVCQCDDAVIIRTSKFWKDADAEDKEPLKIGCGECGGLFICQNPPSEDTEGTEED